MYKKINEEERLLIEQVCNITNYDYFVDSYGDLLDVQTFVYMISDMIDEYKHLKEEYEEYQEDVDKNYKFVGDDDDYYDYHFKRDMEIGEENE